MFSINLITSRAAYTKRGQMMKKGRMKAAISVLAD